LLRKVPEVGRWDDIFVFTNPVLKSAAYTMLGDVIRKGQSAKQLLSQVDAMSEDECAKILSGRIG
jgi:hypothetical protein